ncbi:arachidonate 5-lipoxygenase [Exaiptasia diaphana]|uniref:Lipoxygenase domain-containing protein n=1 Tax=Exaiptasia diaphana TaxID=2652724 RepID=A0A913YPB2_EXADI|nr:arachidonate 5-lipoxygenase [Exaiptasia diaphana]
MTANALSSHYQSDPLNAYWMGLYKGTIRRNIAIGGSFLAKHAGQEFKVVDNYTDLFEIFVKSQKWNMAMEDRRYFKFPFQDPQVPFQKIIDICKWREDQYFTEQRLAGVNPMSIQRVSYYKNDPGVTWSQLQQKLNTTFPWTSTIRKTTGKTYLSFYETLQYNYVYVLHYPEYDSLETLTEHMPPGRTIKKAVSPIAIFVSKPRNYGPNKLVPIAIQMGHTQDSPVYTPDDSPDEWLLAKQTVQVADFAYGQTIEHLLKTHLFMEPICASVLRYLDILHPLHQILKYHCRGIFGTNKFGGPYLLNPYNGTMEKLFAVGFKGAKTMMSKAFGKINWDMTDFQKNIKDRGLDDKKKLPFYPYRDDGQVIYKIINDLSREYINL